MTNERGTSTGVMARILHAIVAVIARALVVNLAYGISIALANQFELDDVTFAVVFAASLAVLSAVDFAWRGLNGALRPWAILCLVIFVITLAIGTQAESLYTFSIMAFVFMSIIAIPVAAGALVGCTATIVVQKRQHATGRRIEPVENKPPTNGPL